MESETTAWLLVCALVVSSAAAVPWTPATADAASVQDADATIEEFAYSGDGSVADDRERLTIWRAVEHEFSVSVSSEGGVDDAQVCLVLPLGEEEPWELDCGTTSIPVDDATTVSLSFDAWPENLTGERTIDAVVRPAEGNGTLDRASIDLDVVRESGDLDDDGLPNGREASLGTDLRANDTDGDGLADGVEVDTYDTSPTSNDTDGDGLGDLAEVEEHETDPTAADSDDDGLPDPRELEIGTDPNRPDTDGDGVSDGLEVNTYDTSPTDPDSDGDGLDDGSEIDEHQTNPSQADTDGDGLDDNLEVTTYGTDPKQIDTDGDGLEDGVEVSEHRTDPTVADTDDDGLADGEEVNTYDTNPTKADTDGDGLEDGPEVNEYETDPTKVDTDGDGVPDPEDVEASDGVASDLPVALPVLAGAGVAGIALLLGLLAWSDRVTLDRTRGLFGRAPTTEGADESPPQAAPADEAAEAEAGGDGGTGREPAEVEPGQSPDEAVPAEFLSDEERVLDALDAHGGRVRQSAIVEETGWSKSKVSRVLSEMEADGTIVKIDVGRHNVVTRPEDLPPDARSLFDD